MHPAVRLLPLFLALAGTQAPSTGPGAGAGEPQESAREGSEDLDTRRRDDLEVRWSEDADPLYVPRGETLVYRVRVGVGGLDTAVGTVTMSSSVEPYQESVLLLQPAAEGQPKRETAHMEIHAEGDYQLYSMDATIATHIHPVDWPRFVHKFEQRGSKQRRREVLLGIQDETLRARYARDTSRNAPKGTRIWKEPKERDLPVDALDMLSASYFARAMVREDRLYMSIPVADKLDLWEVRLKRGRRGTQETYAGVFDAVQVRLDPRPYPGEVQDEKTQEKAETFEGLFGLHGSIELWAEARTGIPIRILGDLPVGPIDLTIDVVLKSFAGTPDAFRPVP